MRGTLDDCLRIAMSGMRKTYGIQPLSICDECFSPLEIVFDLEAARSRFTREAIAQGPLNMWRYRALLPVPTAMIRRPRRA